MYKRQLLESGCYVGLGSDGAAYNSVDLFEEMRVLRACLISYYVLPAFDPVVMPVKTALRLSGKDTTLIERLFCLQIPGMIFQTRSNI